MWVCKYWVNRPWYNSKTHIRYVKGARNPYFETLDEACDGWGFRHVWIGTTK